MRTAGRILLLTLTIACLTTLNPSEAKKPDNNGGGGTSQEPPTRFTVLELPFDGGPVKLSETNQGILTVAVGSSEAGYSSAAFVRLEPVTQIVLDHGFLPEPLFQDPNDGEFKNGPSHPADVNDEGTIVGFAATYEDDLDYTGSHPSPGRGVVWTYNGTDYSLEILPTLNLGDTHAAGINNSGEIVGNSDGRAVLWDADTHTIHDLNNDLTASLGWELVSASDINDAGLVVGRGRLAGKLRGFLLDLNSGEIFTVPLIGPADANTARRINANGRIVGTAWDGQGVHYGTNPDYVQGYSWDGPGSAPVELISVTNNTSSGSGLNDLGASTGNSYIPDDDWLTDDAVPSLWEFDESGELIATDLTYEIPSKPSWFMTHCYDVNNDGWISVVGRTFEKGRYRWSALLLIPNGN